MAIQDIFFIYMEPIARLSSPAEKNELTSVTERNLSFLHVPPTEAETSSNFLMSRLLTSGHYL